MQKTNHIDATAELDAIARASQVWIGDKLVRLYQTPTHPERFDPWMRGQVSAMFDPETGDPLYPLDVRRKALAVLIDHDRESRAIQGIAGVRFQEGSRHHTPSATYQASVKQEAQRALADTNRVKRAVERDTELGQRHWRYQGSARRTFRIFDGTIRIVNVWREHEDLAPTPESGTRAPDFNGPARATQNKAIHFAWVKAAPGIADTVGAANAYTHNARTRIDNTAQDLIAYSHDCRGHFVKQLARVIKDAGPTLRSEFAWVVSQCLASIKNCHRKKLKRALREVGVL